MAAKSTKALNMALMALTPECDGPEAQELENLVYKLPGAVKAEYETTETECNRLETAAGEARAGRSAREMVATSMSTIVAREETDNVVTEVVTLAVSWAGNKKEELSALAKQLPRAVMAERTSADARMERLKAELAPVDTRPSYGEDMSRWEANQLGGAATGTREEGVEIGKAPPSAPATMRLPVPPVSTPVFGSRSTETEASRLQRASTMPRPASSLGSPQPGPHGRAPVGPASHRERARSDAQWRAVPAGQGELLLRAAGPQPRPLLRPPYQAVRTQKQHQHQHLAAPKIPQAPADAPQGSRPPSAKRRKVTEDTPVKPQNVSVRPACGNCNYQHRACNSKARCQHCEGRRCVYVLCERGSVCTSRKCNCLHPGQWESGDTEGREYLVKGVNIFN
ncbi:hypothetical protein LTR36_006296 [Oleoguttula mirabilis]|uniref:Uncharacterized protein n=1 Tax=Oleoguttula mirabilis TaxID=1507867 RepID=A0AAV9JBY8_9PEZI|nr:hypothetical protein LTR36_006296 [Oleoguttula mirabilis]